MRDPDPIDPAAALEFFTCTFVFGVLLLLSWLPIVAVVWWVLR